MMRLPRPLYQAVSLCWLWRRRTRRTGLGTQSRRPARRPDVVQIRAALAPVVVGRVEVDVPCGRPLRSRARGGYRSLRDWGGASRSVQAGCEQRGLRADATMKGT